MNSYTAIINDYVDEFTNDPAEVRRIVVDTAERFRDDYYRIVDIEEDDFDKVVLDDFFDDVREAIRVELHYSGLL